MPFSWWIPGLPKFGSIWWLGVLCYSRPCLFRHDSVSRIQKLLDKIGLLRICFKSWARCFCWRSLLCYHNLWEYAWRVQACKTFSLTKKAGKQPVKEQKPKKKKKDKNKKAQNLSDSCIDAAFCRNEVCGLILQKRNIMIHNYMRVFPKIGV